ncbi:MAG: M23 family metallopeptidase [Cytophagales bacterium]|nr:M23 family metallopeptidase [Cytophagales bacterium]
MTCDTNPVKSTFSLGNKFTQNSGKNWPFRNTGPGFHWGNDYLASAGTAIPAIASGVVFYKSVSSTYGNWIVVKHVNSDGYVFYSLYAHMQSPSSLNVGQNIYAGTTVGFVGNTGSSATGQPIGVHLHLEIVPEYSENLLGAGHATLNPNTFSGFEGIPFLVDVDVNGNNIIQINICDPTSQTNVTIRQTVSSSGVVLGESVEVVSPVIDASGNVIGSKNVYTLNGTQVTTYATPDGTPTKVISIGSNGTNTVIQDGITFTTTNGVTTAVVPGVDGTLPVGTDGSVTLPNGINIKFSDDPMAGGTTGPRQDAQTMGGGCRERSAAKRNVESRHLTPIGLRLRANRFGVPASSPRGYWLTGHDALQASNDMAWRVAA